MTSKVTEAIAEPPTAPLVALVLFHRSLCDIAEINPRRNPRDIVVPRLYKITYSRLFQRPTNSNTFQHELFLVQASYVIPMCITPRLRACISIHYTSMYAHVAGVNDSLV